MDLGFKDTGKQAIALNNLQNRLTNELTMVYLFKTGELFLNTIYSNVQAVERCGRRLIFDSTLKICHLKTQLMLLETRNAKKCKYTWKTAIEKNV